MKSISARLQEVKNHPSGFDYMRLVLALMIIIWHTAITSYGDAAQEKIWKSVWWAPFGLTLPMFFALSGFLVAGSLERCKTLITFLGLRVLRIVPALSVEVFLSALVLGPIFTVLPLREYFSNPMFHDYFFNILGDIHYYLPGVFENNPHPKVNGQLWTVPWELVCYVVLTGFALFSIYKKKMALLALFIVFYGYEIAHIIVKPGSPPGVTGGFLLVATFVTGLLIYRFREQIPLKPSLFLLSFAVALILMDVPDGNRLAPLPIAYMTVYLGLLNPPRNRILLSGDYSYGLFLYGFPIQQAFVALGLSLGSWQYNLLASIPCAAAVAVGSWWLVEKPMLRFRDTLKKVEALYLDRGNSPDEETPELEPVNAAD